MILGAIVAAVLAAALASFVTAVLVRRRLAVRLSALATATDPDLPRVPTADLQDAFSLMERAIAWVHSGSEARLQSFAQLQAAADALPVGLVVAGRHQEILLRNATAAGFLGVRYADALVEEALRANLRTALSGQPSAQTLDLLGPPRRSISVRAVPVESVDVVAVALIEDVSERARLEAMRTDFVANISHELRTPVGALALLAETMVDEQDPALTRRLAEKMVTEANRVTRIIEDLLELSRIEHDGRPRFEVVPVGLLAAEAVERVRTLADSHDITVHVEEPSRRLTVAGDRRQLVSALANLIENGIKYSDPGSTVEVSARTDGAWAELVVADHGIGIPRRDQDRIFERFYRVDRARSRDTGGTGLGLAIVRHVATNHGGTVSVSSVEGAGSTFSIRVPACPGPVAVTMPEAG